MKDIILFQTDSNLTPACYARTVFSIPDLTEDEEKTCLKEILDKNSYDHLVKLVSANLKLVVKIAKPMTNFKSISPLDLYQEGAIGLIKSIYEYDFVKAVGSFKSWASIYIKSAINGFLINNVTPFKIGTTKRDRKAFFNMNKSEEELKERDIDIDRTKLMKSLTTTSTIGGVDVHSEDYLIPYESDTNKYIDEDRVTLILRELVDSLEPRTADIIKSAFFEDIPYYELAEKYGISIARVGQIVQSALKQLREKLNNQYNIDDFEDYFLTL